LLCFGDVVVDVHIVAQLDADLDDVQTHLDDMLAGGAIVSGPHIAFECILQAWQAVECILQAWQAVECILQAWQAVECILQVWQALECILQRSLVTVKRLLLSCCVHAGGMASFYEVCVNLLIHFMHIHVLIILTWL